MTEKFNTMPIALLRQLLNYDSKAGELTWKHRPQEMFPNYRIFRSWNGRYAGTPALNHKRPDGYCDGIILRKHFRKHRVIWALVHGEWPDIVDHEDHGRDNNDLDNISSVSQGRNNKNLSLRRTNTSEVCGVHWHPGAQKWCAQIQSDRQNHYLGVFALKSAAIAVRKAAEVKYGFHPNHGARAS